MSTYDELFLEGIDLNADDADGRVLAAILKALCAQTDATREQTQEFRNLRIALTQQNQASGSVYYPWCATCNCYHHPEDDNCILRGGNGAIDITTAPRQAPQPSVADILNETVTEQPETTQDTPIRQSPGGMSREEYFAQFATMNKPEPSGNFISEKKTEPTA